MDKSPLLEAETATLTIVHIALRHLTYVDIHYTGPIVQIPFRYMDGNGVELLGFHEYLDALVTTRDPPCTLVFYTLDLSPASLMGYAHSLAARGFNVYLNNTQKQWDAGVVLAAQVPLQQAIQTYGTRRWL